MFKFLYPIIQVVELFLVPVCFVLAWAFVLLFGWSVFKTIRDTTNRAQEMHKIPCTHCQFFVNDHRLKCTVQPFIANTEEAISCSDYCPRNTIY